MMAGQLYCLIVFVIVSVVSAQPSDLGAKLRYSSCPTFPLTVSLNESDFTGTWYEIKRTTFLFELNTKCVTTTYFPRSLGGFNMNYDRKVTWPLAFDRSTRVRLIPITRSDKAYNADIRVRNSWISMGTYRVLYTDYTDIAITYTCSDVIRGSAIEAAWIFSRTRAALTSAQEATVTAKLAAIGLGYTADFKMADYTNCE